MSTVCKFHTQTKRVPNTADVTVPLPVYEALFVLTYVKVAEFSLQFVTVVFCLTCSFVNLVVPSAENSRCATVTRQLLTLNHAFFIPLSAERNSMCAL